MALNIKNKNTGDLLTATEFNMLVQAVKNNEADIASLCDNAVKMVALTQAEDDKMVTGGTLDANTYYNILEEE